jgi:hypothetical protein
MECIAGRSIEGGFLRSMECSAQVATVLVPCLPCTILHDHDAIIPPRPELDHISLTDTGLLTTITQEHLSLTNR